MASLRQGRLVDFRPYDWTSHRVSEEERSYVPEGVVLVEGVYMMREVLLLLYDVTVWVVLDHEERAMMVVNRGMLSPQ